MIVILYPAGGFGTTIEYCLKNFSYEHGPLPQASPIGTGSMHSYQKEFHIYHVDHINVDSLDSIGIEKLTDGNIINSIYPLMCSLNQNADVTVQRSFKAHKTYTLDNHVILIKFNDIKDIEISYLMKYEKIPMSWHAAAIKLENCLQWNSNATSVLDLERWQLRELLSIQFNDSVQDLLDVEQYAEDHWLVVGFGDVLKDLSKVINNSIKYVGWTRNSENLDVFSAKWTEKQQSIASRLEKIENIVSKTLTNEEFNWGELELIDQVLIQARLSRQGYELMCDGLNLFPTNSVELKNLLIKI